MWSATLKEGGYTFGAWVLSLGLFVTPTVLIYVLEQCLLNTMRQGWFAARGAQTVPQPCHSCPDRRFSCVMPGHLMNRDFTNHSSNGMINVAHPTIFQLQIPQRQLLSKSSTSLAENSSPSELLYCSILKATLFSVSSSRVATKGSF